jgi:hypothetical protein
MKNILKFTETNIRSKKRRKEKKSKKISWICLENQIDFINTEIRKSIYNFISQHH